LTSSAKKTRELIANHELAMLRDMQHAVVENEPEIEDDSVVLRVIVEDPAADDSGGVFICRLRGFGSVTVERFPRDQAPVADGRLRAIAVITAMKYAVENHDAFEALFAKIHRH
jgi:hypothetical protein